MKSKLFAIGVLFTILGLVLGLSVTAQRNHLGNVTCSMLEIVDSNGKSVLALGSDNKGGVLLIGDGENNTILRLENADNGGQITVYDESRTPVILLLSGTNNGIIAVKKNGDLAILD